MIRKFSVTLAFLSASLVLKASAQYTPLGSPTPTPAPTEQQPARAVMVNSNSGLLLYPPNLWSANASNARLGLGLGTAATNPASAFQVSSTALSNLASNNAAGLTNLRATNLVGMIPSSNIPTITFTNINGTLAITSGGTGATNSGSARTNLGLGWSALTNSNASTSLLGFSANGQIVANTGTNALTFTNTSVAFGNNGTFITPTSISNNGGGVNVEELYLFYDGQEKLRWGGQYIEVSAPFSFNGTNAAQDTRINLGLGATWLTNTNLTTFRTAIGLGSSNSVSFGGVFAVDEFEVGSGSNTININSGEISFGNVGIAAATRINLGLGSAATNSAAAFQPAASALTNLASGNGGGLTNLRATNLVGVIPASNIPTVLISNVTGVLPVNSGGTGATNSSGARTNLGFTAVGNALGTATDAAAARTAIGATVVGSALFTASDSAAVRAALSLGSASTNLASAFQPSSSVLTNLAARNGALLTNLQASNIVGLSAGTNITGVVAVASGGTGATNSGAARTNLGLGWSALTNANAATSLLGVDASGNVIANTETNTLTFTKNVILNSGNEAMLFRISETGVGIVSGAVGEDILFLPVDDAPVFSSSYYWNDPSVRSAFGFSTNLSGLWLATNAAEARNAIGAGTGSGGAGGVDLSTTNATGILPISKGGTGATNATGIRQAVGLGATWLTNSSTTQFRTAIGLGATWLTNTNAAKFREAIGVGIATNTVQFDSVTGVVLIPANGPNDDVYWTNTTIHMRGVEAEGISVNSGTNHYFYAGDDMVEIHVPVYVYNNAGIELVGSNAVSSTRANLGFNTSLNNLWTATNAESARNALGVGSVIVGGGGAVDLSSTNATGILPITKGGTGATTAGQGRTNLGATAIGNALFTASNLVAARQALGLQTYSPSVSASLTTLEIGLSYTSVVVTWSIDPTNATYAVRQLTSSNSAGAPFTNNLTTNFGSTQFTFNPAITNDRVWALTIGDGLGVTNTATTSVNFLNYMSWGRSNVTTLNNAGIQTLHNTGGGAGRAFAANRSQSFSMDGGGQYLYVAYPLSFGSATAGGVTHAMLVDGNVFNNFVVTTNTYTNASGYVSSYLVYRTANIINGSGISFTVQ